MWGELACHERLFNPPLQLSRLGTWCPNFFCTSVLFVSCMYLDGGMGGGGWLLTSFFSIIYILGLVCYKHTIHEVAIILPVLTSLSMRLRIMCAYIIWSIAEGYALQCFSLLTLAARMRAARVTVVVLCVCMSVCLFVVFCHHVHLDHEI